MGGNGDWTEVALGEVVSSLGGLWGQAEPADGHVEVVVLRGTDFAPAEELDLSEVPRRFEKEKAVRKRLLGPSSILLEASGGSKDQPVGRTIRITDELLQRAEAPLSAASFCKILTVDEEVADVRFVAAVLRDAYRSGAMEIPDAIDGTAEPAHPGAAGELPLQAPSPRHTAAHRRRACRLRRAGAGQLAPHRAARGSGAIPLSRVVRRLPVPGTRRWDGIRPLGGVGARWLVDRVRGRSRRACHRSGQAVRVSAGGDLRRPRAPAAQADHPATLGQRRFGHQPEAALLPGRHPLREDPPLLPQGVLGSVRGHRLGRHDRPASTRRKGHVRLRQRDRLQRPIGGEGGRHLERNEMPRADPAVLLGYDVAIPDDDLLSRFERTVAHWLEWSAELVQVNHALARCRDVLLTQLVSGNLDLPDGDAAEDGGR